MQSEPYLMRRERNDGIKYEGFCVDLIEGIAKLAGFNYTISLVKDGRYGAEQADGSWTGMIGEVIRNVGLHFMFRVECCCFV